MSKIEFTAEDINSQTWRKVKATIEGALAQHRINLEGDASPDNTLKHRGAIQALKQVLALETPALPIEDD